ncbi:sporulation protein YpjB [Bacillus solimangrovi]|uniref:Sporulation protein YpjB n=1 Tax=Bacillus solimangrovi TaxID=1305675 RepID=A0A1E5LH83_9BACI|nr:sporulation protein YpjB [Bacillus solimangrovi]OEH93432.1 hypothetical protein BFG57_00105 [Bacillus solimangrovi]
MQWKMIIIFFFTLFFIHTYEVSADQWSDVEKKVERALQLTKQGDYDLAIKYMEQFSGEFLQLQFSDKSLETEQIQVLNTSYQEARHALIANDLSQEKRVKYILQFRLALDAVKSTHQPLWTELEQSITTTFQDLKEASNNNQSGFRSSYDEFRETYALIYPSLVIDRSQEQLLVVNQSLADIDVAIRTGGQVTLEEVHRLELAIMALFDEEELIAQSSLIWLSVMIGSMIMFTLFYVAWRKYNGEKKGIIV